MPARPISLAIAAITLCLVVVGSGAVVLGPTSSSAPLPTPSGDSRTLGLPAAEATAASSAIATAARPPVGGSGPSGPFPALTGVPGFGRTASGFPFPLLPGSRDSSGSGGWQRLGTVDTRYSGVMAYDAADGYVLEFGGYPGAGLTWTYANGSWTNITPNVTGAPPPRAWASMVYDATLGEIVLFGGYAVVSGIPSHLLNDTWTYRAATWTNRTGAFGNAPDPRAFAGFAYDPNDSADVLFGGITGTAGPANGTWELSSGGWSDVTDLQTTSPTLETMPTMAEDGTDGSVVLFTGGSPSFPFGNATWTFTGNRWANVTGTAGAAPVARQAAGAVMDSTGGGVVLFGGYGNASPLPLGLTDTWRFVHGSWTQLSTGVPTPEDRLYESMSDDPGSSGILLAGGVDYFNLTGYTDTWSFSAGHWTLVTEGPSPNPRSGPSMAYDSSTGQVILFGGSGLNDTWSFSHGVWSLLHPARSPSGRFLATLTDDPADGELVLFGGEAITGGTRLVSFLNDTWVWANGTWTNITATAQGPPAREAAASAYDSAAKDVVLYGGSDGIGDFYDTWTFHGGHWTAAATNGTAPRASVGAALADDPSDSGVLLFGGVGSPTKGCPQVGVGPFCRETWTFSGGNWTNRTTSSGPAARWYSGLVYDSSYGTDLLYGGEGSVCHKIGNTTGCVADLENDTWSYASGHWTNLSAALGTPPDGGVGPAFAYDRTDGSALLYGSTNGEQSNIASGSWWSLSTGVSSGPISVGVPSATVNPVAVGNSTTLTVTVSGGAPPYAVVWEGLPVGCGSANSTSLTCTPSGSGTFTVAVRVTDTFGATATGSPLTLNVTTGPVVLSSVQISPAAPQVKVGTTVSLSAQADDANGHALSGVRYTWTFTPRSRGMLNATGGADVAFLANATTGTVVVQVAATFGSTTLDDAVTLTVFEPTGVALSVTSFSVSPSSVPAGASTTFTTGVTGGTTPYEFAYTGLPSGCPSVSAQNLSCMPTAVGTFPVEVQVTDFAGAVRTANATLTVVPAAGGTTSALPGLEWVALGAVVVGIAVVATILVIRGRARSPAPPSTPEPDEIPDDGGVESGGPPS